MTLDTDDVTLSAATAASWLRRWDAQQQRYVADRQERFAVLCDVVATALAGVAEPVIVDLGCGPGSLAARMHERLPSATVIGIDSDPLLLAIARANYPHDIRWVDADLATPSWQQQVPATIHAAVSTTALHWLPVDSLAELYRVLASRMAPGGVLANGDHLGFGDARLHELATAIRDRRAERAGVLHNEQWRSWWDAILAEPEFATLAGARAERLAERRGGANDRHRTGHGNGLTVEEHTELLRAAGFSGVAPMWQVGDDHVLIAIRS
ncbi:MAG: methyltransferase domain-containing protein [Sciscionella sp.]|nr:methyltransferase domain-containing protein [Sciscionella sp.]